MSNKINSLINPASWHERAINHIDQCAKAKGKFKQLAANSLAVGTGAIAGISQIAKFVFAQPAGMALKAAIGLVRVLTWKDCLTQAYRALPSPKDWLKTAGKIVAYTIGIAVSALAVLGSFLGSKSSQLNVRYHKRFTFTKLPVKMISRTPAPVQAAPIQNPAPAPQPQAQQVAAVQPAPLAVPVAPPVQIQAAPVAPPVMPVPVLQAPAPVQPIVQPPAPIPPPAPNPPPPAPAPVQNGQPAIVPPQPEPLTIENVTAAVVPPVLITGAAIGGAYALRTALSCGASLVQSAAGSAFSLLASAAKSALPAAVKNVTATVVQPSVITPIVVNASAAAAPYVARAALSVAKAALQNQCPLLSFAP